MTRPPSVFPTPEPPRLVVKLPTLLEGCQRAPGVFSECVAQNCSKTLYLRAKEMEFDPMTGHRPFKELTKGFSEMRKARVASRLSELMSEMALHEGKSADHISDRHEPDDR